MSTHEQAGIPSGDDSKIISFGLGILIVVFGLVGGWMATAPLSSAAVAIGKVSADLNQKTVQHLEGGIVEAIHVKDGDLVHQGDPLLKFKNFSVVAEHEILSNQYLESLASKARLDALRDKKKAMELPQLLQKRQDEPEVSKIIKDQMNTFKLKIKMIQNDRDITNQRMGQIEKQLEGLKSLLDSKKSRLRSINEEIDEFKSLYEKRLVDKTHLRDLQREQTSIEGDIASSYAEISRLEEQKSEIESQFMLRQKEVDEKVLADLVSVKVNIAELRSRMVASQDAIDRMVLMAPITGTVVGMKIHTVGAVISPGAPIMELVPEESKLIVLAQVKTTDIDKVRKDLLADVRFSAFDTRSTHVLEGRVIHVGADSRIDEVSGAPYYEAKIELTPRGIEDMNRYKFELVAGMPAEVMFKIGERTVLEYLIKPFVDMFKRSFTEE